MNTKIRVLLRVLYILLGKQHAMSFPSNDFIRNDAIFTTRNCAIHAQCGSTSVVCMSPSRVGQRKSIVSVRQQLRLYTRSTSANTIIVRSSFRGSFLCDDAPAPSLCTLNDNGIICVNTFSTLLLPNVHVDFVILDPTLTTTCRRVGSAFTRATSGARRVTLYTCLQSKGVGSHAGGVHHLCAKGTGALYTLLTGTLPSRPIHINRGNLRIRVRAPVLPSDTPFRRTKLTLCVMGRGDNGGVIIISPSTIPTSQLRRTTRTITTTLCEKRRTTGTGRDGGVCWRKRI